MATMNQERKPSILAVALALALGAGVHAQSLAPDTTVKPDAANLAPAKVVEVGSQLIKIKKGSIDDVDAVGHRDIGTSRLGNWYSASTEANLGHIYSQEVEQSVKLISDPLVQEYVNRIGQKLVSNSDCKVPFTIKVIDANEINAMALPGGFFYVNSGLILNADSEAELAGAMAHEIAHVCAHHFARQMTRTNMAQVGMAPAMVLVGGWAGLGVYGGAQFALPASCLQFSRELETQADYLGVQYMYRAGYDPRALITYFEKVQTLDKRKPGLVSKAFNQHPQTPERIQRSQEEIAQILPARAAYIVSTSEFEDVKARLTHSESKRNPNDEQNSSSDK
ncbi:M48 family metallopeptidase [Telmatobacter bradus]|uniref:M48 family metallopeptidase n=1 Tax=Telmatobacter bradus TaxID=474953 RepID=UPI003B43B4B7